MYQPLRECCTRLSLNGTGCYCWLFRRDYHVILACDILGQSMILSRDISAILPKYSVKFTCLFSKEINQTKTEEFTAVFSFSGAPVPTLVFSYCVTSIAIEIGVHSGQQAIEQIITP